jgi:hypothetical protein
VVELQIAIGSNSAPGYDGMMGFATIYPAPAVEMKLGNEVASVPTLLPVILYPFEYYRSLRLCD